MLCSSLVSNGHIFIHIYICRCASPPTTLFQQQALRLHVYDVLVPMTALALKTKQSAAVYKARSCTFVHLRHSPAFTLWLGGPHEQVEWVSVRTTGSPHILLDHSVGCVGHFLSPEHTLHQQTSVSTGLVDTMASLALRLSCFEHMVKAGTEFVSFSFVKTLLCKRKKKEKNIINANMSQPPGHQPTLPKISPTHCRN